MVKEATTETDDSMRNGIDDKKSKGTPGKKKKKKKKKKKNAISQDDDEAWGRSSYVYGPNHDSSVGAEIHSFHLIACL